MAEPVSWKEVQVAVETAVEKSENRILKAIGDLRAEKDQDHLDYETRLRRVEAMAASTRAVVYATVTALTGFAAAVAIAKNIGAL